jgi:hypothetical protein
MPKTKTKIDDKTRQAVKGMRDKQVNSNQIIKK